MKTFDYLLKSKQTFIVIITNMKSSGDKAELFLSTYLYIYGSLYKISDQTKQIHYHCKVPNNLIYIFPGRHLVCFYCYTNDAQLHIPLRPDEIYQFSKPMDCIDGTSLMTSDSLLLHSENKNRF